MIGAIALGLGWALGGAAQAGDAGRDWAGGGSDPGAWTIGLQAGAPWQAVRVQRGLEGGWTPLVEHCGAFLVELRPSAGVARRLVDGESLRLGAEVVAGGLTRSGDLAYRGPSAELRLRAARSRGAVWPWATLASRHTLTVDVTTLQTASGDQISRDLGHRWTPAASAGLGVSLGPGVAIAVGLDWPWLDPPGLSLPGAHLALAFGVGP